MGWPPLIHMIFHWGEVINGLLRKCVLWDSCLECDCKLSCEAWNEWNTCQWQNRESTSRAKCRAMSKVERRLGSGRKILATSAVILWHKALDLKQSYQHVQKKQENDLTENLKTTFVLPLSHSLPWHSVGRCDCWLGVAEILQIMHSHLGVQKNTSELVTQKTSSVANATRLHNSKIGWGFHTTLLRCTVGKFQLTNPSAKLWQNENCDFPTSDLQETRWAFAQFRLPLNLRLQHRRLELPLPLFYSKRLIQWLDLTVCHFVEMNGYIQ